MKLQSKMQPQALVRVLLDETAEFGDRDDAAMDLGSFDDPEAEAALMGVASDPRSDEDLVERCTESLCEIWLRRGRIDRERWDLLPSFVQRFATAMINANNPSLLQ